MKVIQITDLHARMALPGHAAHQHRLSRQIPVLLEEFREVVAREKPDLLVLTGDVLDGPHSLLDGRGSSNLEGLAACALKDYEFVRDWLEGLGVRWMALPGNHDHGPSFDRIFGRYPKEITVDGVRVIAFHDWELENNQARRIDGEHARFVRSIDSAPAGEHEVHIQHYLIHPYVDYSYPLLYGDAGALAGALASAPAKRLVLSGHWHGGTPVTVLGNATFSGCPAFCEPPHRYRVYEFEPGGDLHVRHEALRATARASGPIIVLDRTTLLTQPGQGPASELTPTPDARPLIQALSRVARTIVASRWDDPDTTHTSWRQLQYLHDDYFHRLGVNGDGFLIYLTEPQDTQRQLPAERVARLDDFVGQLRETYPTTAENVLFVTADPARAEAARAQGAKALLAGAASGVGELADAAAALLGQRARTGDLAET